MIAKFCQLTGKDVKLLDRLVQLMKEAGLTNIQVQERNWRIGKLANEELQRDTAENIAAVFRNCASFFRKAGKMELFEEELRVKMEKDIDDNQVLKEFLDVGAVIRMGRIIGQKK